MDGVASLFTSSALIGLFLAVRIGFRLWYLYGKQNRRFTRSKDNDEHSPKGSFGGRFYPKDDLNDFLKVYNISNTVHSFRTSRDGVKIEYTKLGNGPQIIYLCNGVGTDLNMWLPIFMHWVTEQSDFFSCVTLIAPAYRGLLGSNSDGPVSVTFDNCVSDIEETLRHTGYKHIACMVGWSTGAQIILKFICMHPKVTDKVMLLNPSMGETLHSVMQPVVALPRFLGQLVSMTMHRAVRTLRPLCMTRVWGVMKMVLLSDVAYYVLHASAFLGGFPPEQPSYFMSYLEDTFCTRYHTQHLLDLIACLDERLPVAACCSPQQSVIITGFGDVITGVYHGEALAQSMVRPSHHCFLMGSHFLLMEFPSDVADLLTKDLMAEELDKSRAKLSAKTNTRREIVDAIKHRRQRQEQTRKK